MGIAEHLVTTCQTLWPQAANTISRTRAASAWPLVAFITAPTIAKVT